MPSPILIYEDPAISTASARTATTTSPYSPSFSTLSDTSSAIEHWIETIPLTWDIGCLQWPGCSKEGHGDGKENVFRHCCDDDDKAKLHLTHPYTPRVRTGKRRHMSSEDQEHPRKRRNVQTPGLTTPPALKGYGHVPMTRRPMGTTEHLHDELDELADPDATPRSITATVHGTQGDRPPLFAVPAPNFAPPPERAVSSSSRASRSTASAKSSRSRSPTKLGAFQLSSFPVVFMPFGAQGYPTPSSVQGLCDDIEDIVENGEGIIPRFLEKHLDVGKEKIRRRHFASEWPTEAWPEDEFWSRLKEVHRCAQYCQIMKLSESSWNTEVHSRVLSLALSGRWSDEGLWYIDVTTAKIDKSLLPRINDIAIESRMVDYCLVLDRPEWKRQVVEKLKATNLQSINHSSADYLRFTPIALSIETKRGGDGEDKANVQLGIWVCAHFTQLQKLVPPHTPLPVLLVLIIQGDNWRLMTAECTASHEVHILQYLDLGKTSSILGILKLLASLRRIAAYIHDVYMPWYEQYVLSSVVAHSTET